MKYSELTKSKKKRLDEYLKKMADGQASGGKEVLEQTAKSVLLANTGGIAVTSSIVVSTDTAVNIFLLKISVVVFVIGVLSTIIFRFRLAYLLGKSVKELKGFHMGLINGVELATDEAIREKMELFQKKLDGYSAVLPIMVPIMLFIVGAICASVSLFL